MTVSNVSAGVLRYGNGVTQEFDFSFEAQDASHVKVAQVLSTAIVDLDPLDYSVSLTSPGGTVTLTYIPDNTVTLYIYRKTSRDQLVSVSSQNRYDPAVTEEVWDKLTLAAQEMQAEIDRAIKTTPGQDPQALLVSIALSEQNAVAAASAASDDADDAEASALAADADALQTAADRIQTGLDRTQTGLDAIATAADRLATGGDRTQTGLDAAATAADRIQTGLDRTQTGLDKVATAADRVQTGLDADATAADRVQTGLDRSAAAASAAEAALYVPTVATQAEAEAGTDNTKLMTPLRTKEAIQAQVSETGVIALSGASTDISTSIPAGVKRITVWATGLSLSGSGYPILQLGTGGAFVTTGYKRAASSHEGSSASSTAGFPSLAGNNSNPAATNTGSVRFDLRLVDPATNTWQCTHTGSGASNATETGSLGYSGGGDIALSGPLDRLRMAVTTASTYDAGTVFAEWGF